MFSKSAVALAAGLVCWAAAPCSVDARTLSEVLKAQEFRVGVNVLIPPRAQLDEKNEMVGFDVDIANELAKKLGVKLTLVSVNGPERIPYVATDRIDASLGGMTRTSERAKVVDFTLPISGNTYGVMTREETGITSFNDVKRDGVNVAMSRGTAVLPTVQSLFPQAKFVLFDSVPDRDRALAQGRADAIVDLIDNPRLASTYPNVKWRIFPLAEIPGSFDSLAVAQGNDTLRLWLNIAIYELHTSGFIQATWEKWFKRPMAAPITPSPFF